jgi:hypothetical protein
VALPGCAVAGALGLLDTPTALACVWNGLQIVARGNYPNTNQLSVWESCRLWQRLSCGSGHSDRRSTPVAGPSDRAELTQAPAGTWPCPGILIHSILIQSKDSVSNPRLPLQCGRRRRYLSDESCWPHPDRLLPLGSPKFDRCE